jgi:hypothetical protein
MDELLLWGGLAGLLNLMGLMRGWAILFIHLVFNYLQNSLFGNFE